MSSNCHCRLLHLVGHAVRQSKLWFRTKIILISNHFMAGVKYIFCFQKFDYTTLHIPKAYSWEILWNANDSKHACGSVLQFIKNSQKQGKGVWGKCLHCISLIYIVHFRREWY